MVDVIKNKEDEEINSKLKDLKTKDVPIFKFDDLVISPEKLKESRIFQKAVRRKEYEIIIPKDEKEILLRDLKTSPFNQMADRLIQFYVEIDTTTDYLAQNYYLMEYLTKNNFYLPWLVPVVKDLKKIYKKKLEGPLVQPIENSQLMEIKKNFTNNANIDHSQIVVESLHNYQSIDPINMINHIGDYVLRLNRDFDKPIDGKTNDKISEKDIQFRGSYKDMKLVQLIERKKTIRKEIVVGYEKVERVSGEQLNVIGFALLPHEHLKMYFSNVNLPMDWFKYSKIIIKPNHLESILRECIPTIGGLLTQNNLGLDYTNLTDVRILFKLFEEYGHGVRSITPANRKQISELIQANLNLNYTKKETYTITDRLEYPNLEKEIIGIRGSGILSENVIVHPAMVEYRIPIENYKNIFHRYLQIVGRLDNGDIWFNLIRQDGDVETKKKKIANAVKKYRIIENNKEIKQDLENSYANLRKKTPHNYTLFEDLDNPILNILETSEDKRDRIAWFQYFKRATPDREEKNYIWHGKKIGCQHDFDRLYQKFEDPSDPYPYGKRYTRIFPQGGVKCGFCGTTLIDDNDLVDQGYDSKGQKINIYNEGLIHETTNIELFLKRNKSEIVRSGEKLVEQWLEIEQKVLNKKQIQALKYEILKPYEQVILDNKFLYGLQQNPNKLIQMKEKKFGEFLVKKYKIADANQPINYIFIQKIFSFFYSLASIYDIIIQRLAVFMVLLNWHLVREDPSYLDPNILLNFYNLQEIGTVFMNYNLSGKTLMENLTSVHRKGEKQNDQFYDLFMEKAPIPQDEMSTIEYQKLMKEEYNKYRTRFLYSPGVTGEIFNGNFPLEHEIMRIFSEYKSEESSESTTNYLRQLFVKYWKIWLNEHQKEAKVIETNARIALMPHVGILSPETPRIRPLFDRYLAQRHFILTQQLEQVNLDLINANIYSIRDKTKQFGGAEDDGSMAEAASIEMSDNDEEFTGPGNIIMKKMYLLNKMNCHDWTNVSELDLIGIEEETARLKQIQEIVSEIHDLETQMKAGNMYRFYWPINGHAMISRNYSPRGYNYFNRINYPPDPLHIMLTPTQMNINKKLIESSLYISSEKSAEKPAKKLKGGKKEKDTNADTKDKDTKADQDMRPDKEKTKRREITNEYPYQIIPEEMTLPERKEVKIASDDIIGRNKILKDVSFVDKVENWLNKLGEIDYLGDLEKYNKYTYKVINDKLKGVQGCNVQKETREEENSSMKEFDKQYETVMKNIYSQTRMQLTNMKKYIITYLRQKILLLSRLDSRQMMIQYGLEGYLELFEYSEFNAAFVDFNSDKSEDKVENSGLGRIFTNEEIDNLIMENIGKYEKHVDLIKDLQNIFLTDIVRHLRMVRNRAGRFVKGKKKLKEDEPDAAQIFVRFIKILFDEIKEQEKVDNVDFNHLEINQIFMLRIMWHKMDTAEKKGELEWKIMRHKLNSEETQLAIDTGGDPLTTIIPEEEWDDGELDVENEEDDYNDNDYAEV